MPLASPGVQVSITDESFFIPGASSTVPLIIIATAEDKLQPNNSSAVGTKEFNVVRTVTSIQQSLELYGVPKFYEDSQGRPFHGDARNEYGLLALNQFLGIGNLAYVVRANVNLNDDIVDIRNAWDTNMEDAALTLEGLITSFIDEFNITNGYIPSNINFKTTVTASELISLTNQATSEIWEKFSFKNLKDDFFDDNTTPAAASSGFQIANYGGTVVGTNPNGKAAGTYTASIVVDGTAIPISYTSAGGETFTQLVNAINADLGVSAIATITGGNIRIQSSTIGSASTVQVIEPNTLFTGTTGFVSYNVPINGVNADSLIDVFGNGYTLPATDQYYGFEGMVNDCIAQLFCPTIANEFTPSEGSDILLAAADLFKYTVEFKNLTSLGANNAIRRLAIVEALSEAINNNNDIRSESVEYNLILCPGYHEVVDDLVNLSIDIKEEAMVIADTPMNLDPDEVVVWADTNAERQRGTNVAYYYGHSLLSNIDGKTVLGAASGTALRTISYSDSVSEVWFAPAGTTRGRVSGVANVGYVSGTLGTPTTFVESRLSEGQRDNLYKYLTNVNPITFMPGRGILLFGQKTSAAAASARDRINVERMIMYIRRQLRKNTLSFVFQPNDTLTRANLKAMVDGFLNDILIKRGLYDYASQCDETNNTPDVIDRNELYIQIALKPAKAAEFIFIPITVVATGTDI